jgi:hypothetical protein
MVRPRNSSLTKRVDVPVDASELGEQSVLYQVCTCQFAWILFRFTHSPSLAIPLAACIVFQRRVQSGDSRQNKRKADGHAKEILYEGSILRIHTRSA